MRGIVVAAFGALVLIGLAQTGAARAGTGNAELKEPTHIPPEALGRALRSLAKARNLVLVYRSDLVGDMRTVGVSGDLTGEEAFARLLRGTGLTYRFLDDKTITIVPVSARSTGAKDDPRPKQKKQRNYKTIKKSEKHYNIASATYLERNPADLATITVTAQKYKQLSYNVPISLDVIGAATLKRNNILNLESLQNAAPGLTVQSNGFQRRIAIEGVGDTIGSGAQVAEYINDADITASPNPFGYNSVDFPLYDLARVEVLRGPQGTLYGEGSEAGAIHFVANKPTLYKYEFSVTGDLLFTKGGAPSQYISPTLNIPLINQRVGIRISGLYGHDGGWIDQPAARQQNINDATLSDTRMQLLWAPINNLQIRIMEIIHRKSYGPNVGADDNENFSQAFNLISTPRGLDRYEISNIAADYVVSGLLKLTNSATYLRSQDTVVNLSEPFPIGSPSSSPPNSGAEYQGLFLPEFYSEYRHFVDEFRIMSDGGQWHWIVGGFFKKVNTSTIPTLFCFAPVSANIVFTNNSVATLESKLFCSPDANRIKSTAVSEFMDIHGKLSKALTLGAGVRHFRNPQNEVVLGVPGVDRATFSSTDPRLYAIYRMSRHFNIYANVAKGFRSGGFNSGGTPPYGPETSWRYEMGVKTRQFESVSGSFDMYFCKVQNYQNEIITAQNVSATGNAGEVKARGVEGDLKWRPVNGLFRGWEVTLNGEYVNSRFAYVSSPDYAPHDSVDFVPRYSFYAMVRRNFLVGRRDASIQITYSQVAKDTYRDRLANYYGQSNNRYLLGFGAGIYWSRNLWLGITAHNLLDDRGYIDPNRQFGLAARIRPMTAGFEFTYK